MKKFFKEHPEYQIVHSHIDAMSTFPLMAAKKANIKIRIAHSHSSKLDKDLKLPIKIISKKLLKKYANNYFACGDKAGRFLFKDKDFKIINNAIDLSKFEYNEAIRNKVRENLKIQNDALVIGHVGRYIYIKNQSFLIDVFKKVLERNNNSCLLLVGAGPDEEKLRNKVRELKIEDNVRFLINRADVNELYQAMDCFVMPSLFEGLPVVGVEAQASGMPCVFSDKISKEVIMTQNAKMIELDNNVENWTNAIVSINKQRNEKAKEELMQVNYDVKTEAKKLMNIYMGLKKEGEIL
jgi:glycosyltransferase involved in cell wall biosynthesis